MKIIDRYLTLLNEIHAEIFGVKYDVYSLLWNTSKYKKRTGGGEGYTIE